MFRLFAMLLALPWPVMALIAAGLFWAAKDTHQSVTAFEAEKAEALQRDLPAPVALDQFTKADVHAADEVHVTAWINTDHNYELTKKRKGTDTVRRMFVLFGPGDAADSTVARGIVLLRPDEVDGFVALLLTNVSDPADARLPFHLNGSIDQTPELSDMVRDAFAERGLTRAAEFVVIAPWLEGRGVALAADPEAPMRGATIFGALGSVAALLALGKALRGGKRRKAAVPPPPPTDAERAAFLAAAARPVATAAAAGPTGLGYATVPTPKAAAWSPLEAVLAKHEAGAGKGWGADLGHAPPMTQVAEREPTAPRWRSFSPRNLVLAVGLYGLVAALMGGTGEPLQNGPMSGAGMDGLLAELKATLGPTEMAKVAAPAIAPAPARSGPVNVPPVAGQVKPAGEAPDITTAGAVPDWVETLSPDVQWAEMMELVQSSAGIAAAVMALLLSAMLLTRRKRQRVVATGRDPWDRLSDRLR